MNIILLSRKRGRPVTVQLPPRLVAAALGVFALLFVAMGVGGVYLASHYLSAPSANVAKTNAADDQLRALSARTAELQARLLRLDALGEYLAESANLKSDEFDFTKKPPMGGPLTDELTVLGDKTSLEMRLDELAGEIDYKEIQLDALGSQLSSQRKAPSAYLANMPVRRGYVTSRYGYRTDPFTGRTAFHGGIDFAGPEGTDVFAVAPGIVTFAGIRSGYGNVVEINHGDNMTTRYAHARNLVVKAGDMVAKDQLVAYMGSTGRSSGPHLHYEVMRNGTQVDPSGYIAHVAHR
ncbi:MAG: M23 family metallopeptidase [Moraxellaceae bacterium]|jgi:murein DD-endopeptidase MepM/ murein hydrolase activator NlpD|nr:M23 family metallopeptidase [Moraxellaceae bacterium]MBP9045564.1 M23 family metallopeptidase [Moraxellaceae bacterium]MBP9729966.1 M23 family metallopeptidase [Moraxellaceae bacterium]HQV41159.1 M23 family metallopeptidase [Moraxellaceae bacterium]HQX89248.1 M23 family metallopeptidase [Moraxellaceae bacterium]